MFRVYFSRTGLLFPEEVGPCPNIPGINVGLSAKKQAKFANLDSCHFAVWLNPTFWRTELNLVREKAFCSSERGWTLAKNTAFHGAPQNWEGFIDDIPGF